MMCDVWHGVSLRDSMPTGITDGVDRVSKMIVYRQGNGETPLFLAPQRALNYLLPLR